MPTKETINDNSVQQVEASATYRPDSFDAVVGQTDIVRRLKTLVERAKLSRTVLSHVLFVGPEGSGKKTIAHLVAKHLGVNLRSTSGLQIDRAGNLAQIVNDLDQGDVLFIEDIEHLRKELIGVLLPALEAFELNIVVGKGLGARTMKLAIKPFTLIGSARKESICPRPLANSFHGLFSFRPYDTREIQEIIERMAKYSALSIEPSAAALVAGLANGSPAKALSLLQRLYSIEKRPISEDDAGELFALLGMSTNSSLGASSGITDSWTNLSGVEFERLVTNLLVRMGFVAEMTKASGDGGIDIEAFLDRPIVGGRYLFQCKRFAPDALIGSPTIREFYGALVADRKAVKGIFITTSGFTTQAKEFAANLPIELVDGIRLQNLLKDSP